MMFKRAIVFLAAAVKRGQADSSPLEVVPNVLIKQDCINGAAADEELYSIVEAATVPSEHPGRFSGTARLSTSLLHTLEEKMGLPSRGGGGGMELTVPMTTLTESSPSHVDCYTLTGSAVTNRVAIVMLNTNPDAVFVQGNVTVPIVEGSLVHFDGNIPHNTIVNSGSVQFLGPFDAKNLVGVMAPLHCSGVRAKGFVFDHDGLGELKVNLKVNKSKDGKVHGTVVVKSGEGQVFHAIIDCIKSSNEGDIKYAIVSGKIVNLFDDQGASNVVAAIKVDAEDKPSFGFGYVETDINCNNFIDLNNIKWLSPELLRPHPLSYGFRCGLPGLTICM